MLRLYQDAEQGLWILEFRHQSFMNDSFNPSLLIGQTAPKLDYDWSIHIILFGLHPLPQPFMIHKILERVTRLSSLCSILVVDAKVEHEF